MATAMMRLAKETCHIRAPGEPVFTQFDRVLAALVFGLDRGNV